VRVSHPDPTDVAGTSHLEAAGDTLTLQDFQALVSQVVTDRAPAPCRAR